MVVHTFAFIWSADATEALRTRAKLAIRGLQGRIPGLLQTYVGDNTSPRSLGYELGGVMVFESVTALEAYATHPAHQELLDWLMPLVRPVEVDFDPES